MKKGFTLIELLVVVLIIGILSAIALPKYEKALERARLTEAVQNIFALQRAIDVYLLENGGNPTTGVEFSGAGASVLNVDIFSNMNCSGSLCSSKHFNYSAGCGSLNCAINVEPASNSRGVFTISLVRNKDENVWEKTCLYDPDDFPERICKAMEPYGFEREAC